MPDRVRKKDIDRERERIKDAIERDPEKYGPLRMLLDDLSDDYDPEEEPEDDNE